MNLANLDMQTSNSHRSIKTQALNKFSTCNRRLSWETDLDIRENHMNEKRTHNKIKDTK